MVKPVILYESNYTVSDLADLKKNIILKVVDIYKDQLAELFEVDHPTLKFSPDLPQKRREFVTQKLASSGELQGNWVYFPWNGILIHCVNEEQYNKLRTNRNKNLITQDEQQTLYDSCVGFAGLSIGSSIAVTLAYQGIAKHLKIADYDVLETTNLNRLRAGIHHIGTPKIDIATQQLYEVNPYADLICFEEGLGDSNIDDFLNTDPKPSIVLDAIDDLKMKMKLRLKARESGVCIVMFTNVGDGMLVDIERYDKDPRLPLFNGRIGDVPEQILNKQISKQEENQYVLHIVGVENIPQKAIESVQQIGKTLVGRPQLASTVTATGGIGTYLFRELLLGKDIPSGRRLIKFKDFIS